MSKIKVTTDQLKLLESLVVIYMNVVDNRQDMSEDVFKATIANLDATWDEQFEVVDQLRSSVC